jgi:fibronectin-binding autotransporter adhesin
VTVSAPLGLVTTTNIGGTGPGLMTLAGLISGTGGLTKDGLGGLRVHGYNLNAHTAAPNTFSGGTTINNGTLVWGTMDGGVSPPINAALGTGPVTLNPGGTLQFERVDNATNTLICNGGTLYSNNGWGAKWGGPVTLNATTTVDATWNMTFNGNISGAGGFTTKGGRVVTLAGTNSFTGANKVTAGTLTCTNAAALGTGTLDITTGAKVALNFTGTRTITAHTTEAPHWHREPMAPPHRRPPTKTTPIFPATARSPSSLQPPPRSL